MLKQQIRKKILELTRSRGSHKTACPSDIAKSVAPENWRFYIDHIRAEAANLQKEGKINILQKGEPVSLKEAKGPIRLQIREHDG